MCEFQLPFHFRLCGLYRVHNRALSESVHHTDIVLLEGRSFGPYWVVKCVLLVEKQYPSSGQKSDNSKQQLIVDLVMGCGWFSTPRAHGLEVQRSQKLYAAQPTLDRYWGPPKALCFSVLLSWMKCQCQCHTSIWLWQWSRQSLNLLLHRVIVQCLLGQFRPFWPHPTVSSAGAGAKSSPSRDIF